MKKKSIGGIVFVVFLLASFLVISAYGQEDVTEVRDSIFFGNKIRPPVPFNHEEHNEQAEIYECNVCHHVWEDGKILEYESSEDMECSECHYEADPGELPMDVIAAYHNNCKGCHLREKAGPVLCSECHVE